jgi:hypothetical protein
LKSTCFGLRECPAEQPRLSGLSFQCRPDRDLLLAPLHDQIVLLLQDVLAISGRGQP